MGKHEKSPLQSTEVFYHHTNTDLHLHLYSLYGSISCFLSIKLEFINFYQM